MRRVLSEKFRNLKLRSKIIVTFSCVLFLSFLLLAIVMQKLSSHFIANTAEEYTLKIVNQFNSRIEEKINTMNETATQILYSGDVYNYLKNDTANKEITRESLDKYYSVQKILESFKHKSNNLSYLSLYCVKNGEYISGNQYTWEINKEITSESWYHELVNGKSYVVTMFTSDPKTGKIVRYGLARKIVDKTTEEILGVIVLEASVSDFAEIIGEADFGEGSVIIVSDKEGRMLWATDNEKIFEYESINQTTTGIQKINGKSLLVIPHSSEKTGFTVISVIPTNTITKDVYKTLPVFIYVGIMCVALGSLVFVRVASTVAKPIEELSETMGQETHELPEKIPDTGREDEVGKLITAFNNMIQHIETLVNETYRIELDRQGMEINMLHAQMEPHFMNNTLEVIRLKAIKNDDFEVAKAISYLGKYMRLKLDTSTQCVAVKDEMDHITGYTRLLNVCGNKTFDLIVDIEDEVMVQEIPKFSLQPLVENSIKYAFKTNTEKPVIEVCGYSCENRIIFSVKDNGVGIENAGALINALNECIDSGEHIGLKNIQHRLHLIYGPECSLNIESTPGEGTVISFSIPRRADDESIGSR